MNSNALNAAIDQSTADRYTPRPKIEGAKLVKPYTLELIVTAGYELYHVRDEIDANGKVRAVLGFRKIE